MKKHFFRSNIIYNQPSVNIDRESGKINNVVIANYGKNKNGTFFSDNFLEELLDYGNNAKNGIKARFGHPNMCSTSLGSFVGRYTNFRIENRNLYGDLKVDDIAKKTKVEGRDISMFDWLFDMAENNPDVFGNSIHIIAEDTEEVVNENGEDKTYYGHKLLEWVASDIVDDPAATENLFYKTEDFGVLFTNFLDENQEVFNSIENNPEIIADFFERYENYINRKFKNKNKVSVLERIRKALGQSYDIDLTLANGEIITVITDAEEPAVGDNVKDANGGALADGEHLLPNGEVLVTENGIITEIKEKEEPTGGDGEEEPTPTEIMNAVNALSNKFGVLNSKLNAFKKYQKDNDSGMEMLLDKVTSLDSKFHNLAKGVGSDYEALETAMKGSQGNFSNSGNLTKSDLKDRRKELKQNKK